MDVQGQIGPIRRTSLGMKHGVRGRPFMEVFDARTVRPGRDRRGGDGGLDLRHARAPVTGVASGIGAETARILAARGTHVAGTARDLDKARRTIGRP